MQYETSTGSHSEARHNRHTQATEVSKVAFEEWVGEHIPDASGGDEIQQDIERLRVSNTSPRTGEPTREVSPQHRWGRVFAERAAPLPRIRAEALEPALPSPGTPPLVRRAAVRRKRMHASDTIITYPIDLQDISTMQSLPPPNTSGGDNKSPDISPITTRDSGYWNSPTTVTPATSMTTLPLSFRLPLTPSKTSPIGATPSTAGLPRVQGFSIPKHSSSLSVPNSPAFRAMNLAYQSGVSSTSSMNTGWRSHTDPSMNADIANQAFLRARSASPMVHDYDPRLHTITQSEVVRRTFNQPLLTSADSGHDATRRSSPAVGHSSVTSPSAHPATEAGSRAYSRKSSNAVGKSIRLRCVVCMEKYKVSKMIQAPNCMHFLCSGCVTGIH